MNRKRKQKLINQAWTCAAHILEECGKRLIDTTEGYLMTEDDKMYWINVYSSMAEPNPDEYNATIISY
jgi:hypothetical protein